MNRAPIPPFYIALLHGDVDKHVNVMAFLGQLKLKVLDITVEPGKRCLKQMIHIENLSKQFNKVLAVDHINLDVPAGEIMGFLGPNGAGKTTTIRMLAGLMRPDTGVIRIGGVDLGKEPEKAKATVGFVPDRPYLY